jgi:hypothetical protein
VLAIRERLAWLQPVVEHKKGCGHDAHHECGRCKQPSSRPEEVHAVEETDEQRRDVGRGNGATDIGDQNAEKITTWIFLSDRRLRFSPITNANVL